MGYARVSTAMQKNGSSIDCQIENIKMQCKWMKHTLISIYCDDGISAVNLKDRPAYQEMIKVIRDNCFKIKMMKK